MLITSLDRSSPDGVFNLSADLARQVERDRAVYLAGLLRRATSGLRSLFIRQRDNLAASDRAIISRPDAKQV